MPAEDLPPVLTRTMRLSVTDIFHVFSNFLGLRPSLLPSGSHLFTVDKDNCRKSLELDDPHRRSVLAQALRTVRWLATNGIHPPAGEHLPDPGSFRADQVPEVQPPEEISHPVH